MPCAGRSRRGSAGNKVTSWWGDKVTRWHLFRLSPFHPFTLSPHRALAALCLLLVLALLAACGPAPANQSEAAILGFGSTSPQDAASSFFENLNEALNDVSLGHAERRRYWADRLASSFAPAERSNQRILLGDMLTRFSQAAEQRLADVAANAGRPTSEYKLTLEVESGGIELVSQRENRASVRLTEGMLRLRVVQRTATQGEIVVLNSERPLAEALGLNDGLLPAVRISGLWFMSSTGEGQG
jgi:hypothetical protein